MHFDTWVIFVVVGAMLIILGIVIFPGRKTTLRQPEKFEAGEPAHVICARSCDDRLCQRYGCPSDPNWKGDMR
jgi:hypothetical protein